MLKIEQLIKKTGTFKLEIDQLTIPPGITLLIGHNGAGKSTFLKLLATATSPSSGTITYNQLTAAEHLPVIRSDIGYLPTKTALYDQMTPSKFIAYISQLKGLDASEEMKRLSEIFPFDEYKNKKIRKLSQGQKQKLAITQAFLGDPNYVFLDEPLMYLDIQERQSIMNAISHLAAKVTFVIATHELDDWAGIADSALWLDHGTVLFYGSPKLWVHTQESHVWEGSIPIGRLDAYKENFQVIHTQLTGKHVQLKIVANGNPNPSLFHQIDPSMEDAYFIRQSLIDYTFD